MSTPDQPQPDRRQFLSTVTEAALKIAVVAAVAPALDACGDATGARGGTIVVDVSALTQDGQALMTQSDGPDGAPVVVVRQSASEFLALSTVCTHQGCLLDSPSNGIMFCPCHGSEFNLQGAVVRGPAQSSLARFSVSFDATTDKLTIT
jgi:thiosulfate dehydrogenase [quinone] large subunit